MTQTFLTIAVTCFALAFVLFVTAAILFFALNIRSIAGELSGKTATAAIARIRSQTGLRQYRALSMPTNKVEWDGEIGFSEPLQGQKAQPSGPLAKRGGVDGSSEQKTSILRDDHEQKTGLLQGGPSEQQTSLLSDDHEQKTGLLTNSKSEQATSLLANGTDQQ
jgi:hypothetical protein